MTSDPNARSAGPDVGAAPAGAAPGAASTAVPGADAAVDTAHGARTDASPDATPDDAARVLGQLDPGVLYAPEQDMWVRREADGAVTVGATHLVAAHGQFMLFTPRPAGTEVGFDRSLGVMETAKTAVAVHAPLAGRVLAHNEAVVADVTLVERDPYGAGWLLRMQPADWATDAARLQDATAYATWLAPRLAAKLATKPIDDEFAEDLSIDPHRGY